MPTPRPTRPMRKATSNSVLMAATGSGVTCAEVDGGSATGWTFGMIGAGV